MSSQAYLRTTKGPHRAFSQNALDGRKGGRPWVCFDHGEPGESQPTESTDDAEVRADFWSIQGHFICHHHNEPRVQLHVSREETFPVPLKYIDVTRSTHTDLDVLQQKRIDDCWFTKFTSLKERPSKRYMWSRVGLTKIQATTRPDHVWPEVWTKIGKAAQNRHKQEWAKEKPKLDNVRRLRGIYSRSR